MQKHIALLIVTVCVLSYSCIKDTDFEQIDDFSLTPVVELNFLYFTLEIGDFQLSPVTGGTLTATDTTEVRFLDDTFAQENIVSAEFFFRVSNSFPLGLGADFVFLSEENEPFYEINFAVLPGENSSPTITEFTQSVSGSDLELLTQNNRVISTLTINTTDGNLEGVLNLQSKTTYFLEFSDF